MSADSIGSITPLLKKRSAALFKLGTGPLITGSGHQSVICKLIVESIMKLI